MYNRALMRSRYFAGQFFKLPAQLNNPVISIRGIQPRFIFTLANHYPCSTLFAVSCSPVGLSPSPALLTSSSMSITNNGVDDKQSLVAPNEVQHQTTHLTNDEDDHTTHYKVSYIGSQELRKELQGKHVILPISINQNGNVHENNKFTDSLLKVARDVGETGKVCVLVDDSLQAWTKSIIHPELDIEVLRDKTIKEGDAWLQRNQTAIEQAQELGVSIVVKRWNDFSQGKDFQRWHDKTTHLYLSNPEYRLAMKQTVDEYLARFQKQEAIMLGTDERAGAFDKCLVYLLEECACMCRWAESGYDIEVYPGARTLAMQKTRELLIEPAYPDKVQHLALRFKKRGGQVCNDDINKKAKTENDTSAIPTPSSKR